MQKQYKYRQIAQFSYRKEAKSTLKGVRNLLDITSAISLFTLFRFNKRQTYLLVDAAVSSF